MFAFAMLALPAACATRANNQAPQAPSASEQPWDAGLPRTPAAGSKGVVVPSDMGLGAGPSGQTTNSAATPPVSPSPGPPGVGQ